MQGTDTGGNGGKTPHLWTAYSDLERGIYCFSTVALVFLLLMLEEGEIKELLPPLLDEIEKVEGRGVAE